MSAPILKLHIDERDNISVRVSQDVQVLTREEANRIEAEYRRMQAENAKLRELVRDMYRNFVNCDCELRLHGRTFMAEARYAHRMRELGVVE